MFKYTNFLIGQLRCILHMSYAEEKLTERAASRGAGHRNALFSYLIALKVDKLINSKQ